MYHGPFLHLTCNANDDNEDNNVPLSNIEHETTHDHATLSGNIPNNDIFPESDVESITTETSMDSNKEYQRPTYAAMMEISNKNILFPKLKKKVEGEFLCKECIFTHGMEGISASTLSVQQDTYGIATVLKISCGNNHIVNIICECIDNTALRHSTKIFVINYKFLILMQLLGKGLKTISIIVALLGMHVALGSYKTWKEMMDKLGTIQESLAKKCCMDNLQKEIDATKERGDIHIQDGRIGITASGDAGWQGGGSCMTYNGISGHTLLIGGDTNLVIAFKFFSKMCTTCNNFYKQKREILRQMRKNCLLSTVVPKIGQKIQRLWSQWELLIVL